MAAYWTSTNGDTLAQGDLLTDCPVPAFPSSFSRDSDEENVPIELANVIIVTQSCDLENRKVHLVALCPIFALDELSSLDPRYGKPSVWEDIRKGRYEGLHMLASARHPEDNRQSFVVDFRQIFSLPMAYLGAHAASLGDRWRLRSPFLEHFSQAFARFFMRVGLPAAIAPFK